VSIEERTGTLDQVNEKGILLSGARLSYSKWFEGERPTEDALGCQIRVTVDVGTKCAFLKRVLHVGERAAGWKPTEAPKGGFSGGGGGRRFSPEELELKKEDGVRIARSVAIDRAISMVEKGIQIEKIAPFALAVEAYLLKGDLPQGAKVALPEIPAEDRTELPPSANQAKGVQEIQPPKKPQKAEPVPPSRARSERLRPQAVNSLFNEAVRGGLVKDWKGFVAVVQSALKEKGKSPYQMSPQGFAVVESFVRSRLSRQSAA